MSKSGVMMLVLVFLTPSCVFFTHPVLSSDESSESPWVLKEPMPTVGAYFKAGVVNAKVYLINWNVTYKYDLQNWSTKKPMAIPRNDFALTSYQNKIYCIGGRTNSGPEGANEVYDPASDSWESKTMMPTPRHGLDANAVNGKIYLISGLVPDNRWSNVNADVYTTYKLTNVTEVYDPSTDTWITKAPIPNAAAYYASAVVDDRIYIISEKHTQIYDPTLDVWSYGTASPFSVDMADGATITGVTPQRIYLIGGRNSGLEVPYNQVYNPENNSWSMGTPMPTARYGLAVAVADNKIFAIGGLTGSFVNVVQNDRNEQYDPLKDKSIPAAPATSPSSELDEELFPTVPVVVTSVIAVVMVGVGLTVYFKKRKR